MKYLIKNKHWNITEEYNLDKLLYLLIDRPNLINRYNDFIWENIIKEGHRDYDLPAYIRGDGSVWWDKNNKFHRENGPAVEYTDGTKCWYLNGERHREDGPAIECSNGNKEWWLNGELHRENGPAVEYPAGTKEYWSNGIKQLNK